MPEGAIQGTDAHAYGRKLAPGIQGRVDPTGSALEGTVRLGSGSGQEERGSRAGRLLPESAYERLRLLIQKPVFRYPPDVNPIVILPVLIAADTFRVA
jgi:hypothetical protein